jgi:outer membrane protein OmpA-like peptidoglycan-associated protein
VEVSFGSEKTGAIESGDTIKGETPVDFSDAALAVMNQSKTAVASFAEDADALKQNFLLRGFFKQRGYEDPTELKKNRISQLPSQPSSKKFAYDAKDIFDKSDNAKLKNEKSFDQAGKFLEQNKFRLAVIAASVEVGDAEKDRVLTQARAKVVRDYLVQHFQFDDTRVKIIGLGKSPKPDETNKVEILIYR